MDEAKRDRKNRLRDFANYVAKFALETQLGIPIRVPDRHADLRKPVSPTSALLRGSSLHRIVTVSSPAGFMGVEDEISKNFPHEGLTFNRSLIYISPIGYITDW